MIIKILTSCGKSGDPQPNCEEGGTAFNRLLKIFIFF